jgi:hypothetical protein
VTAIDAPQAHCAAGSPGSDAAGFPSTISPDDKNVVAAWDGKTWMLDRATGAKVNDLPTGALEGTHPDWSPAGDEVVFATGKGDGPGGASLAKIPFSNGTWGQAVEFLTPATDKTLNFPMFSFDAQWIAFNQGKGGHTDKQAQLFLVGAAGGQPIELVNANRIVSYATTDGLHQNTAPTWGMVAASSARKFGGNGVARIWYTVPVSVSPTTETLDSTRSGRIYFLMESPHLAPRFRGRIFIQ